MEEYITPNRKCLPYGMMNFAVIRRHDYDYVDKTPFILSIEQPAFFSFFHCPHRSGKALSVNRMRHRYNRYIKACSEEGLSGDLYAGKRPARGRNCSQVTYLNFSGISEKPHRYRERPEIHCNMMFKNCRKTDTGFLPQDIREGVHAANKS